MTGIKRYLGEKVSRYLLKVLLVSQSHPVEALYTGCCFCSVGSAFERRPLDQTWYPNGPVFCSEISTFWHTKFKESDLRLLATGTLHMKQRYEDHRKRCWLQ